MKPELYERCMHCWRVYLSWSDEQRGALTPYLAPLWRRGFSEWPRVWPTVEVAFGSVESFVEAIETVERTMNRG